MKYLYCKPQSETVAAQACCVLCQSDVNGAGGFTTEYSEDLENLFG